jgi:tetratricopeptide (TPR) repeat protein
MKIAKINIPGRQIVEPSQQPQSTEILQFVSSYKIEAHRRDSSSQAELSLKDDNVLELIFDDGTVWFSSAYTLDEVFPELRIQKRDRQLSESGFTLPVRIASGENDRGLVGDIALKLVNVFKKKTLPNEIKKLAKKVEEKQLGGALGLYLLDHNFQFKSLEGLKQNVTYLLFIHGTASSTHGSFEDLKNTPVWDHICTTYDDRILAFQHPSLTQSPLENVSELIKSLPANCTLDIISQSRGGLVGDLLNRFCNSNQNEAGFTEEEMKLFEDAYPSAYYKAFESVVSKTRLDVKKKNIVINRFIRSACPAHGTTLASHRLDNFFNISFNLLGLAAGWSLSPVYIAFKNLAAAVVDCKNDVDTLPGLEAMDPRSAFIEVLNRPVTPATPGAIALDNSLTVISGNSKAGISLKGLLIIASKLFYLHKNDLIVDTQSMYFGAKRLGRSQYFFDEGTDVNHFNYFKNETTRKALQNALVTKNGEPIPGFTEIEQNAMYGGQRGVFGLDGGEVFCDTVTGKKPIVVLIPGIMGSNLSKNDELIWIRYLKMFGGRLTDLAIGEPNIKATSLIRTSYNKLVQYLEPKYDVVTFAFDWRLQLNEAAVLFKKKIETLLTHQQPVKIIAHSMGGVLVRDFMVTQAPTWKKLNASDGFSLIFLGSPLRGSYRIPAVLFGKDAIIDKLSKIDVFHSKKKLLETFFKFPGLLSLLPLDTHEDHDFALATTWKKMASAMGGWIEPETNDLKTFRDYRNAITVSKDIDYANAVYIAGKDKSTPCDYSIEQTGSGTKLEIISTGEGDQSVTWDSGIPKEMIARDTVYYVDVSHGALANAPDMFDAIEELLTNKKTDLLTRVRPEVRGEQKLFKQPELFDFDLSPQGITNTLLGISNTPIEAPGEIPLKVSVSQGDLKYAKFPVVAGHFKNDSLLYAEKRIDGLLSNALNERNLLCLYPGEIGESEFFITKNQKFKGAIIIGLGDLEKLSAYGLTKSVEQGVLNYLLEVNSKSFIERSEAGNEKVIGLSFLIIAIGYGGLSPETSIRSILSGVQKANRKMRSLRDSSVNTIEHLEFIEQYDDRAINCFYVIKKMASEPGKSLKIETIGKGVKQLFGAKKRLASQASEEWWTRITVRQLKDQESAECLSFSVSTGAAREEEQCIFVNPLLIESLVGDMSTRNQWSPAIAKTIFELLIPREFKEILRRQHNVNWLVDKDTAAYPWELLKDSLNGSNPLCVDAGFIRQLKTQDAYNNIRAVAGNNALVIGDPALDGFAPQLQGAEMEATAVEQMLRQKGYTTVALIKSQPQAIITSMFGKDYNFKILHISSHGTFDPYSDKSGIVIGNNVILSTAQIKQLDSVEFAFINCCHLGKIDPAKEQLYKNRYRLAANIGTQLIENGVKAVIVAGWAVDDKAAEAFARRFYENMFGGDNFGTAVQKARKHLYERHSDSNTWGAYQCYGDPYYKFNPENDENKTGISFIVSKEAEIQLYNLQNEMATGLYTSAEFITQLEAIIEAVDKADLRTSQITELEGLIYLELGEYSRACQTFDSLFKTEPAQYMVSTYERYCNALAKLCVVDGMKNPRPYKALVTKLNTVIQQLERMGEINQTSNNFSFRGSAYKRKVFLVDAEERLEAIKNTAENYFNACEIPGGQYETNNILNWLEFNSIHTLAKKRNWNKRIRCAGKVHEIKTAADAIKLVEEIRSSHKMPEGDMVFWDLITSANIELCRMMLMVLYNKKGSWEPVFEAYNKAWKYAGSKSQRLSEPEHLVLLLNALSVLDSPQAKKLSIEIEKLRAELERIA